MPSRIRVLLQHKNGATYWGKRAVYQLFAALPLGTAKVIRRDYATRIGRLTAAAKAAPPDWVLTLIRETRGLKSSKSLYWRMKMGKELYHYPKEPPPQVVVFREEEL
jgi:hypothetical protein